MKHHSVGVDDLVLVVVVVGVVEKVEEENFGTGGWEGVVVSIEDVVRLRIFV